MANGNNVTLVGNVTRAPELRYTASGAAVASFGLAVNKRWQNKQTQEWEEATSFFDCSVWREQAESANESLQQGTRVIVVGSLQQRSWEIDGGEKRSKIEVQVDELGPSLRWATAFVQKNDRKAAGEQTPSGDSGWGDGSDPF